MSIHWIILAWSRFEDIYVAQIPGLPGACVSLNALLGSSHELASRTVDSFSHRIQPHLPLLPVNPPGLPVPPICRELSVRDCGRKRGWKPQLGCVT